MTDGVYRNPTQSQRAALADLQRRASELAKTIDRGVLARKNPDCLADLDAKWKVADLAAAGAHDLDSFEKASAACHELIAAFERAGRLGDVEQDVVLRAARENQRRSAVRRTQVTCLLAGLALVPGNFLVWVLSGRDPTLFRALAVLQTICGMIVFFGIFAVRRRDAVTNGLGFLGLLVAAGGPLGLWLAEAVQQVDLGGLGGAWGRPLRLRGKVLHPNLRAGADWTRGARPDVRAVDPPTRAALEALWLHDAQKEHASVPALARVSWLLAAVGAPADLVEAVHVAALEEIEHARLCFALAAGYGDRSHTVEPMPELLVGGLDLHGDPFARIATESLNDGCLLEDFNADVADRCARACREPVVRDVLERIAREERSHAELSWRLLAFALERGGRPVAAATEKALAGLARIPRPTAASSASAARLEHANAATMRAHGRLPDTEWASLWTARLAETRLRLEGILTERAREAA